jgi:hypothetical protein
MRGSDHQQSQMFSYLSPETRVRKGHPLPAIRSMVDEVLTQLFGRFDTRLHLPVLHHHGGNMDH